MPRLGSPELWLREPAERFGQLTLAADPINAPGTLTQTTVVTQPGDYRGFYSNVLAAIRGEASLAVTPRDAWRAVRLLELARQSAHEQRAIETDLTAADSLLE